jgi:hypothetical protein
LRFSALLMQVSKSFSWKTLNPAFGFLVALIPFVLILVFGVSEEIGTAARYSYSFFLLAVLIVLFFAYRERGRKYQIAALSLTIALFGIPLARLWHTGASESFLLGGLLPWSDAASYYESARSLIEGGLMNVQRPFFPGFLAALLKLTGQNLQITIAILVAISAIATFFAAREIQKTFGAAAAVLVTIGLFLYYRTFAGETMTECLGFPLGTLGFTGIWRGARLKSVRDILTGIFLLALGLNARVGAVLVLPTIILWGCFVFSGKKRFSWKFFLQSSAAVLLAFVLNFTLYKATGSEQAAIPFSNYSYTLYGLLTQSNWYQVVEANPQLNYMDEKDRSREILQISLKLFRQDPFRLLRGMIKAWGEFFWSYSTIFVCEGANITAEDPLKVIEPLFKFLALIGLIYCAFTIQKPASSLIVSSASGLILSIALVPIWDAGSRPYAATMILNHVVAACGLSFLIAFISNPIATKIRNLFKEKELSKIAAYAIPMLGLCTFPFWYRLIPDNHVSVNIKMAAPGIEYARVYWDDPALNQNAYQRIIIDPKTSVKWQVTIEALRRKSPEALDSQIWLTEVSTPEKRGDLTKATTTGLPWQYKSIAKFPWAVASGSAPQSMTLQIEGGELSVQFLRSIYSGVVRVTVNHRIIEFNLYKKIGVQTFKYPPNLPGDNSIKVYDATVPYSDSRKLWIIGEGKNDLRIQEVSVSGQRLKQSGKYFVLPFLLGNRLNRSLLVTIISFLLLFGFVRLLRATTGDPVIPAIKERYAPEASMIFGIFLAVLTFFGPLAIRIFSHVPQYEKIHCAQGLDSLQFRINPGSSINLVRDDSVPSSQMPDIRISDFRRGLRTFSPWLTQDPQYFGNLNPSVTLVDALCYQWLLADTRIVPKQKGPIITCGTAKSIGQIWMFTAKTIHTVREQ